VLVEDWARYFKRELTEWDEFGFNAVRRRWLERAAERSISIPDEGDAVQGSERQFLADALKQPAWLDPATGAPFI
jgi:hypothetical protein